MRFYRESKGELFFDLLPDDWKQEIIPYYEINKSTTEIYLIEKGEQIVAGGIVFKSFPPDMTHNTEEVEKWMKKGYLYLGFIWVEPDFRKQKYGSKWLQALKEMFPNRKYWLTTEEAGLNRFYIQNGFVLEKHLKDSSEWLFSYSPSNLNHAL